MAERNPLEQEVLDLGDEYFDLVMEITEAFAPKSPWWDVTLTPDQQLWRYQETRAKILPWLIEAGAYMGWTTTDELFAHIEDLWFSQTAHAAIPITLQASVPVELLQLVQAEPLDAAKHIRKMERMLADRMPAMELLAKAEEVIPDEAPTPPEVTIPPASLINGVPLQPGPTGAASAPVAPPA